MHWSDLPLKPTPRALRQFAWLWLAFFGGLAAWQYFGRGHPIAAGVLLAVSLFGLLGAVMPELLRPVFVAWVVAAFPVGWLVSQAALAATFFGVFTPLGLVFRMSGRDELALRRSSGQDSYWAPKRRPQGVRSYFRQS
jgi:hypothetical protein